MPVTIISTHDATETDAIEEMTHEGFEAAAKDYQPGKTEPHSHEYDVCLYIVQGEIGVMDLETGIGQVFGPGDKALVDRGTTHSEEHGVLRMVVGRRH